MNREARCSAELLERLFETSLNGSDVDDPELEQGDVGTEQRSVVAFGNDARQKCGPVGLSSRHVGARSQPLALGAAAGTEIVDARLSPVFKRSAHVRALIWANVVGPQ
ncbi:MAG: hypothetical protein H6835_20510 [Planctomycetes bacterium]|nr:hypothetical protein [Planctomycetota bacterium]